MGPLTSCVVALHTALLIADPVMLCCAAAIRSVIDWPDIASISLSNQTKKQNNDPINGSTPSGPKKNLSAKEVKPAVFPRCGHNLCRLVSSNVRSLVAKKIKNKKNARTRMCAFTMETTSKS